MFTFFSLLLTMVLTVVLPGHAQRGLSGRISFEFVPNFFVLEEKGAGAPVRLIIPKIHVNASIERVGLTPDGAMDTPEDAKDVAWLELGQRPGNQGSAVIAGHYGRRNGEGSAFDDLHELRIGDSVTVQDEAGEDVVFAVRAIRRYDPNADASSVFGSTDGKSHLNLITCEGVWDDAIGGYPERLVVFADKVE